MPMHPDRFLSSEAMELLHQVLARRDPALSSHIRHDDNVSQEVAETIVNLLGEELVNNLDGEWEPTDYGRRVSTLLAQFNAGRVAEWP